MSLIRQLWSRLFLVFRWMFPVRYSLLIGAALPLLVPLSLLAQPRLLLGLFAFLSPWQLYHLTWMSSLVAAMVLVTYRVSRLNAAARLGPDVASQADQREYRRRAWHGRWVWYLLMGLPIPLTAMAVTLSDPPDQLGPLMTPRAWDPQAAGWCLLCLVAGWLTTLLLLVGLSFVRHWVVASHPEDPGILPFEAARWMARLRHPEPRQRATEKLVAESEATVIPGYTHFVRQETRDRQPYGFVALCPGHAQLGISLLVVATCYLISYYIGFQRWVLVDASPFPALFFGLLALLVVACFLPGTAFFLDYYRAPPLLVIGLAVGLMYLVNQTEHHFEVEYQAVDPTNHQTVPELIRLRQYPPASDGKRTLVVVAASGGGIQASAWTTQVLSGLEERYGKTWIDSLGILSGVSGGSVGILHYVSHRWENEQVSPPSVEQIRKASQVSALSATGWGIAYPDLMRVFVPFLTSPSVDRGWAIEQVWRSHLSNAAELQLSELERQTRAGKLPVVAFNATIVETGQRLVISPAISSSIKGGPSAAISGRQFWDLYPDADLDLVTAARLSATFPYVSPITRAEPDDSGQQRSYYHFADGGYVDNHGLVAVVQWLNETLQGDAPSRPFDRILLVRIQSFPVAREPDPPATNRGWLFAMAGPLKTIAAVRESSQAERGELEVNLLQQVARSNKVEFEQVTFEFAPGTDPVTGKVPRIPLSWKLMPSQKRSIGSSWQSVQKMQGGSAPLSQLDRWFPRQRR